MLIRLESAVILCKLKGLCRVYLSIRSDTRWRWNLEELLLNLRLLIEPLFVL